jgi:hypothetical protein
VSFHSKVTDEVRHRLPPPNAGQPATRWAAIASVKADVS